MEKITCSCGSTYSKSNQKKHLASKKHLTATLSLSQRCFYKLLEMRNHFVDVGKGMFEDFPYENIKFNIAELQGDERTIPLLEDLIVQTDRELRDFLDVLNEESQEEEEEKVPMDTVPEETKSE